MPDLVDLVRDELARAAGEVTPSPALDARVHARLSARARRRRATVLAAAAAVVALALAVPMLASAGPDGGEQPGVVTDEGATTPLYLVPDPLPPGFTLIDAGGDGRLAAPTSSNADADAGTGVRADAEGGPSTGGGPDAESGGDAGAGSTGGSASGSAESGGDSDAGSGVGADVGSTGGSASGSAEAGGGTNAGSGGDAAGGSAGGSADDRGGSGTGSGGGAGGGPVSGSASGSADARSGSDAGLGGGADAGSTGEATGGSASASADAGGGSEAGSGGGAAAGSTGGSVSGSADVGGGSEAGSGGGAGGGSAGGSVGEGGVTARWAAFDPNGELTDVFTVSWGVGSDVGGDAGGVLAAMEAQGATPVEVRGTDGWFDPATGVLAWAEPDGAVVVLDGGAPLGADAVPQGLPMDADVAVEVAGALDLLPSGEVVAPGIGSGWEAVGQWPSGGAVGRAPRHAAWAGPDGAEVRMHLVTGDEVPPAAHLHAARSHRATVGGREAVVTPLASRELPTVDGGSGVVEGADLVVVWEAERDTQVTLSARRVAEADLLAFAESLRPASEQEWRALVDAADSGPATTVGGTPTTSAPDAPDDAAGPGGTAGTVQPPAPPPADAPVQAAGTFSGHEEFRIATGECTEVTHDLDATFSLDDGTTWELHVDYCGRHEGPTWYGVGPFTLTVPGGDTITGTMDNSSPVGTDGEPYELVVTGGTGAYAGSTGSCRLDNHLSGRALASQSHDGTFTCGITPGGR